MASPPPANGSSIATWLSYFDQTGELDKVSEEQREALDVAAEVGELTYASLTSLIELTFSCVEEQGLAPHWLEPHEDYGFPVPAYSVTESASLGSDASQTVIDDCTRRYSALAEQIYVWQPTNAAIEAAKWDKQDREDMIACLRANGVEIDDEATRSEIEMAALELNRPTGPTNAPVFGVNCFPSE